jgi:hypothetical protein
MLRPRICHKHGHITIIRDGLQIQAYDRHPVSLTWRDLYRVMTWELGSSRSSEGPPYSDTVYETQDLILPGSSWVPI